MTFDTWHLTYDMWHVTDGGRWIFSQNVKSLVKGVLKILSQRMTLCLDEIMNGKSVCRAAPATRGLWNIHYQFVLAVHMDQFKKRHIKLFIKLNGLSPVDSRLSSDYLKHFVKKIYLKIKIWHITHDTWHMTPDSWLLTLDSWRLICNILSKMLALQLLLFGIDSVWKILNKSITDSMMLTLRVIIICSNFAPVKL